MIGPRENTNGIFPVSRALSQRLFLMIHLNINLNNFPTHSCQESVFKNSNKCVSSFPLQSTLINFTQKIIINLNKSLATFTLQSALIDYRRKIRILLKILLSISINFKQHINHDCNHFPEKHHKTFKELSKTNILTSLRKLLILKPFKLVSFLQSQFSFLLNKPLQSHSNVIIS